MARPAGERRRGAMRLLSLLEAIRRDRTSRLFPSNNFLAEKMGRSVRTIQRYLSDLMNWKMLTRQLKRYFKLGCFKTKRFLGLIPKGEESKPRFGVPIYTENDMTPLVPPEVQKVLDEEARRQPKAHDAAFERKKNAVVEFRNIVHQKLGGYSREVKHSPRVQEILRLLERRKNGSNE